MGSPRALLSKNRVTPTSSAAIPRRILATFTKHGTMAQVMSKPALRQTNLANEPADYVAKRDALRLAEIELMRQRERVATLRHFYSAHPSMGDDIEERGLDLLCPVYNLLDLTPQGRGDWYADLGYGTACMRAARIRACA